MTDDSAATPHRPVTVVAPTSDCLRQICDPRGHKLLTERTRPIWNETGADLTSDELGRRLAGAEIVITSWGTSPITDAMLDAAPSLRAVAHAAGSVKAFVPSSVFDRGLAVISGLGPLADCVGEFCLAAALALSRRLREFDTDMRAGLWIQDKRGQALAGGRLGIVGCGATARSFLRYIAPFEPDVVICDPFTDDETIRRLNARRGDLPTAMGCDIVSVHLPAIEQTRGLISGDVIATMHDGAILLQTSRPSVIDQRAMFDEIASGRISAAIDVYDPEPFDIPLDLRDCPNAIFTPHVAGDTVAGKLRLVRTVLDSTLSWLLDGVKKPGFVEPDRWPVMA